MCKNAGLLIFSLVLVACSSESKQNMDWPFEDHSNSKSNAVRSFSNICLTSFPDLDAIKARSYSEGWVAGSGENNWLIENDGSDYFLQLNNAESKNANFTECTIAFSYDGIETELEEIQSQLGLEDIKDERSSGPVVEKMWSSRYLDKKSKILIAQATIGNQTTLNINISRREKK